MKRMTTNLIIAAAALAAVAGSASAQNLKADIPFTFRAGRVAMAPGSYELVKTQLGGAGYYILRNTDTHVSSILAMYSPADPPKAWKAEGKPKLSFECVDRGCSLRELWSGTDSTAFVFPRPKIGSDEHVRVSEIRLTPVKAD